MIYYNFYTYLKKNKNKKKNLAFLLPNFSQGGAGYSILKLCKSINYNKFNIFIISIGKNYYKKDFKKMGIIVIELHEKKLLLSINEIKSILNIIINNNNKKTFLISNINYANVISCIFCKKINLLKIILIERTPVQELDYYFSIKDFFKKKVIKFLIKKFYKYASMRIGNSNIVSKDLKNYVIVK